MKRLMPYILAISLLLGFALIGASVYITTGYQFSHEFYSFFLQHLGLAICFPIIIGFVFEVLSRERILAFVKDALGSLIDHKQRFSKNGFSTIEIGPDEHELRTLMFRETEESISATFLFLRAGLILRVLLPVFRRVMDKGGTVRIISPEHDSAFVSSLVSGLESCSQATGLKSLPRIDTDDEIKQRDREMAVDYDRYLRGSLLHILKTPLYVPYGCLLLEKQVHGQIEKVAYWFPLVVSKTCGYGPMFRITSGAMLNILIEDIEIYIRSSHIAGFQNNARAGGVIASTHI